MAFDPDKITLDLHILVRIFLTGKMLYYADENLSMSDNNFYEGRARISALTASFGSLTEPKQRINTMRVYLDDHDGAIRALLGQYTFGNREVHILVGEGRDLTNYSTEFKGVIRFPNGIQRNTKEIILIVDDVHNKNSRILPVNKFWPSNYPNLEEKSKHLPIPIIYGDWTNGEQSVPAYCIDTTINQFKICDHPILSISQVYKNGVAISHANEDLANATFTITTYDPETDTVTVKLKARKDASGNLIENPADIILDILQQYLSIDATDIDTTTFDEVRAKTSIDKCRRNINSEQSSNILLQEICNEVGMDLYIKNGKYTLRYREPFVAASAPLFDGITETVEGSFQIIDDPEKLYCNKIKGRYRYNPSTGKYDVTKEYEDPDAQNEALKVVRRTIDFLWLYDQASVETRLQRELFQFKQLVRQVKVGLGHRGLLKGLADVIRLTYLDFNQTPLQIRGVTKDFLSGINEIEGWDLYSFPQVGRWCDDSAPNYVSATAEQRKEQGFWADENGLADPGDFQSNISHWY